MLMFGRQLTLPADLEFGRSPWSEQIASCSGEYAARLRENLRQLHNEVRLVVQKAIFKTKIRYDVRAKPPNLKVGDTVWLYNPPRRPRFSPKLQTDWEGPNTVVELVNDVVVQIRKNTPRARIKIVHADRLQLYERASPSIPVKLDRDIVSQNLQGLEKNAEATALVSVF